MLLRLFIDIRPKGLTRDVLGFFNSLLVSNCFNQRVFFVMQSSNRFGLSCALALPLRDHFDIDYVRLTTHARRCLEAGCSSVTVFGTTGEGASVSLAEREKVLDALLTAGINLRRQVLGGVAAASVGDAVEQARVLIDRDCRACCLRRLFTSRT